MGTVAEDGMKQTSELIKSILDFFRRFAESIGNYLEERGKTSAQRELARYIKGGGNLFCYEIQGDNVIKNLTPMLKEELKKRKIPFVEIASDRSKLFIRQEDFRQVMEINRELCVKSQCYFQEVDTSELENAVANAPEMKDKQMFTIHNLDYYEMETLKNKCNDINKGFMVGTEMNKDGTYNVTIIASHLYKKNFKSDKDKDFCKAYLQMNMSLYGNNSGVKKLQIDIDKQIDEAVEQLCEKGEQTFYIVGVDDPSKYIEVRPDQFVVHKVVQTEEGMVDKIERMCSKTDPDFPEELQRYMDRIYDRAIVTDMNLLVKHRGTPIVEGQRRERVIDSPRPQKNKRQYMQAKAEHEAVEMIDMMVRKRLYRNNMLNLPPDRLFTLYATEASKIVACIDKEGVVPEGYDAKDMEAVRNAFADPKRHASTKRCDEVAATIVKNPIDVHQAKKTRTVTNDRKQEGR